MKHICGPSQFSPAWLCQSPKQAPHLSPLLPSVFFQLSNQRDPFTYKPDHADLSLLQTFLVALISSSVSLYSDIGGPLGSGAFHLLTLLTSFPVCHLLTSISRIGSLQVLKWGKHVPVVGRAFALVVPSAWNAVLLRISLPSCKSFTMFYVSLFSVAFIPQHTM